MTTFFVIRSSLRTPVRSLGEVTIIGAIQKNIWSIESSDVWTCYLEFREKVFESFFLIFLYSSPRRNSVKLEYRKTADNSNMYPNILLLDPVMRHRHQANHSFTPQYHNYSSLIITTERSDAHSHLFPAHSTKTAGSVSHRPKRQIADIRPTCTSKYSLPRLSVLYLTALRFNEPRGARAAQFSS